MSNQDTGGNCTRPTGSFYVVLILNCIMWILIMTSYSCLKIYKSCLSNNNNLISSSLPTNTISTQTHAQLSTVVIHPDLDLGII